MTGDASSAKLILGVAIAVIGIACVLGIAYFVDYKRAEDECKPWVQSWVRERDRLLSNDMAPYPQLSKQESGGIVIRDCADFLP